MALYRTYRSKTLGEIVGQEHITTALRNALASGHISHAYLFTGPRGVGKTSVARILAHEVNNLPYDDERQHLDIIEIDAASNRRIDEIRDLRDKVHTAPSSAQYKVYIIDEVHMLTKEAFNALLKTLEEPPAHVIFILATTEVHKLPETIISRTQRYSFKPVDIAKVVGHLRFIATHEKIVISDEALALIAAHGEGSFRDSISLLDQVRNKEAAIELSDIQNILGLAPADVITNVVTAIGAHNSIEVAQALQAMYDQGYEPVQVARQISSALRTAILEGHSVLPRTSIFATLSALVQVPASPDPATALEIALLDAALSQAPAPAAQAQPASVAPSKRHDGGKTLPHETTNRPSTAIKPERKPSELPAKPATKLEASPTVTSGSSTLQITADIWARVIEAIRKDHSTLYSVVKSGRPIFEPGAITLEFDFPFHQKRLNEARNKQVLLTIIERVTGSPLHLQCSVSTNKPAAKPTAKQPAYTSHVQETSAELMPAAHTAEPPSPIAAISNIFGGAELLES